MSVHHPADELLLGLATGRLQPGAAVVVCSHLDGCGECRARLHTLQSLGGVMLEQAEPATPSPGAWERTLERIDAPEETPAASVPISEAPPAQWPQSVRWPASLRGCDVSKWRWMGPGMRYARVRVPQSPDDSLFLLRIGPGRACRATATRAMNSRRCCVAASMTGAPPSLPGTSMPPMGMCITSRWCAPGKNASAWRIWMRHCASTGGWPPWLAAWSGL